MTAAADTEHIVHAAWGLPSNAMVDVPFTPLSPDLDGAFASAAHVVEATIEQNRYVCVPMETRGIVAHWSPGRDELDLIVSCQSVHETRNFFARYLDIPEGNVRVHGARRRRRLRAEDVRLPRGVRRGARVRAASAARSSGSRTGARTSSRRRTPATRSGTCALAIDDDHVIQAITVDHVADVGAYPPCPAVMDPTLLPGPYRIPRLGFSMTMVWTNTMGKGAYRGPWMFETTAREMAIDHRRAGRSASTRSSSGDATCSPLDDLPFTSPGGNVFQEITPLETLEQALEMLDFDAFRAEQAAARAEGRLLGLGVLRLRRADVDGRADTGDRGRDGARRGERQGRRVSRHDVTRPERGDDDGADRRRHPRGVATTTSRSCRARRSRRPTARAPAAAGPPSSPAAPRGAPRCGARQGPRRRRTQRSRRRRRTSTIADGAVSCGARPPTSR